MPKVVVVVASSLQAAEAAQSQAAEAAQSQAAEAAQSQAAEAPPAPAKTKSQFTSRLAVRIRRAVVF